MNERERLEDLNQLSARLMQAVSNLSPQRKKMLEGLLSDWERVDSREDARIPCLLPVDYSNPERLFQDFIHNLSNGGVFIETRAPLRAGQSLTLTFTVPNLQLPLKITGAIVHTGQGGIGIKFKRKLTAYQGEMIHHAIGTK